MTTMQHAAPPPADWQPAPHEQSPARAHRGDRTLAAAAVLLVAFSAWVVIVGDLVRRGSSLDLGFTVDNVLYIVIAGTVTATLLLALGAVAVRSIWLLVVALCVAGLHAIATTVMLVIQLSGGARASFAWESAGIVLALGAASLAVVLALVVAIVARSRRRETRGVAWIIALVVAGVAALLPDLGSTIEAVVFHAGTGAIAWALMPLVTIIGTTALAVLLGIRSPVARWFAACAAALLAAWTLWFGLSSMTFGLEIQDTSWLVASTGVAALRGLALLGATAIAVVLAIRGRRSGVVRR